LLGKVCSEANGFDSECVFLELLVHHLSGQLDVDRGSLQISMAQGLLDGPKTCPLGHMVDANGVTQNVASRTPRKPPPLAQEAALHYDYYEPTSWAFQE